MTDREYFLSRHLCNVLSGSPDVYRLNLFFQGNPCPTVGMESRLTSGGMYFQADNFLKTVIDIHVHRNGEGRISFFLLDIR